MAQSAANVRKRSAGSLWVAPTGTAAPTTHNGALNAAFKDLGYASEDGIEESRDRSVDEIRALGGITVRTILSDSKLTFGFTLLETRKDAVEVFYGSGITDATGLISVDPSQTGGQKSWVFDLTDGAAIKRIYIATGEVTEVEPITYGADGADPESYGLLVTAYPVAGVAAKIWDSTLIV